jgi:hypothetical protein
MNSKLKNSMKEAKHIFKKPIAKPGCQKAEKSFSVKSSSPNKQVLNHVHVFIRYLLE